MMGVLLVFWPVFRVLGVTAFDCITPLIIFCTLLYFPAKRGAPFKTFNLATAGVALLAFAGVVSIVASSQPYEHLLKVVDLITALCGVLGLGYVLQSRQIISRVQMLTLLLVSATVNSLICILQGHFGILIRLLVDSRYGVHSWTRMTGLSEHAIEAGDVAAFGLVIGVGLALHTRKWLGFGSLAAVCAYSMKYSASLTGLFAASLGLISLLVFCKAYKFIFAGIVVSVFAFTSTFSAGGLGLLTNRLIGLSESLGDYGTLRSREVQLSKALELIEPSTLIIGNGYSTGDLPYDIEIHNGLIASLFHFGVLGLLAQLLLILFFCSRLMGNSPREIRGTLLGFIVIFLCAYLTGPALSRRSLWVPLILFCAYMPHLKDGFLYSRATLSANTGTSEP